MSNASDFVIENGVLKKYNGTDEIVVIPDEVKKIGKDVFSWRENLQNIVIPKGVTEIGDDAFYRCEKLQTVTIPDSVTSIGERAFSGCSNLQSIVIPESVTQIGDDVFYYCENLQDLVIPEGVTEIKETAFTGCKKLADENGVFIIRDIFFGYFGNEKEYSVPDGVRKIGPNAFNTFLGGSVNLKSVHIPKSVEKIDTYSFNTAYVDLYMNIHCPLWEVSGTAKMYGFAKSAICRSGSTINFIDDLGKIVAKVVLATKGETEPKENGAILSIRQENHKFDFAGYDENWANLGKKENKILVAITRIQYPYELSDEMRVIYEEFLSKQGLAAGKMFIDEENSEALLFLAKEGFFSKTVTPKLVDYASQQGKTSATMILLAQQNEAAENPGQNKPKKAEKPKEKLLWKKPKTGTKLIGRYIGTETEITFPETTDGIAIEGIADTAGEAPENYKNLVSVVIPEGYKVIGKKAFAGCENLERIVLPESLEEIKSGAFQECPKIREIYFPKNTKSFGTDSFYNSTIGTVVFENPDSYEIGAGIFKCCKINDFVVCGGNFKSKGLVFKKYGYGDVFPEKVWINGDFDCGEIRENGFLAKNVYPLCEFDETVIENASLRELVAKDKLRPDTRTNTSLIMETTEVESIDFRNSSFVVSGFDIERERDVRKLITNSGGTVKDNVSSKVQFLVIPDGDNVKTTKYKKAEELRSKGNNISTINLSELNKHIIFCNEFVFGKDGAPWCSEFFMTPKGDEICINKYIGNKKSVSIPEKIGLFRVTSIGEKCFKMDSDIQHVVIPEGVDKIGENAFSGCYNLKCVVLPKSVNEIGIKTFEFCTNLQSITLPEGITRIGESMFARCEKIRNIKISSGVKVIEPWAFNWCSGIKSIILPHGVTEIGAFAFHGCEKLEKIVIPESVVSIGDLAFENCEKITIHAPSGSYAETYAKKNNIPFVAE